MRDSQVRSGYSSLLASMATKSPRFAYDNRYVYTWIGSQLYRTASPARYKTHTLNRNVMYTNNKDHHHNAGTGMPKMTPLNCFARLNKYLKTPRGVGTVHAYVIIESVMHGTR